MLTRDELFRAARREVAARRQRAVMQAQERRRAAYAAVPALAEAEDARTQAGLGLARVAAQGGDPTAARAVLAKAGEAYDALLRQAGYGPEDFSPAYACPDCRDTGTANGRPCRCVAALVRDMRRAEINNASPLALCGFETFELERYPLDYDAELGASLREYMGKILRYCRQYAAAFAPALAAQLAREHFDRESGSDWLDACQEADLLILDDLGTEYVNALTISVLYELINTRMLCRRPTIYTSNITDPTVFEARYTEKVASRILGSCKEFRFFGADQRRARPAKTKKQG